MNPLIERWDYDATRAEVAPVLPDGCCDVIVRRDPGCAPQLVFARPTDRVSLVHVARGTRFHGLRLLPGIRPRHRDIVEILRRHDHDVSAVQNALPALVEADSEVLDSLALLGLGTGPVSAVASELGVSERTFRRRVSAATGWPPAYWQGLARARRTARMLVAGHPLADAADAQGYADQAHMTRDMRRWFAMAPSRLRAAGAAGALRIDPGYF